jgi:NAD(P)-dependent dehydrogenase (short-subunit alcohol dehydrogenase family)
MNLQLENKLALVTGSTAGIGLAIASALAAEGVRVIINGRTAKRVDEAMQKIRAAQRPRRSERLYEPRRPCGNFGKISTHTGYLCWQPRYV